MTDPDRPFRRPAQAPLRGEASGSPSPIRPPLPSEGAQQLLILDPEFHQSVWMPWDRPPGTTQEADGPAEPDAVSRTNRDRSAVILGAVTVSLALVAALVVPGLLVPPTRGFQPPVVDIFTRPETTWRSNGGQPCHNPPNEDQAILTDARRVWSLDLQGGNTRWSMDLDGPGRVACLPGSDLVARTLTDPDNEEILRTKLLKASSGTEVTTISDDSTVQVIPLGSNIGLVDRSNMLRAVRPGDLGTTLWSRQLPGPPGELEPILVDRIDDDAVQLLYWIQTGTGGSSDTYALPVTLSDGTPPPWSAASANLTYHQRAGSVIVRFAYVDRGYGDQGLETVVLDLQGRELWELGDDQLVIVESHLFVSTLTNSDGDSGYSTLREVNPRTGSPVNGDNYSGYFDFAIPATQGHISVLRGNTLHILGENLQEQPAIAVDDFRTTYLGRRWLYAESALGDGSEGQGIRLTAIDPDGPTILWTLDLDPGQHLEQMGRHLIAVDTDGTLHGFKGSS